jgi:hypothetical protein
LAGDSNPRSRYTVISMLAKTCNTPERRAAARGGLEAVAGLAPTTPDVLRARTMLADFARTDNEPEALLPIVLNLLKLGVLPCTAERSMYESVMQSAQHAAKYYTRVGWHQQAIQVHEALAAKFPETTLADGELKQAEAIRADGLKESLALIDMEVDAPLRNGDLATVTQRYNAIIEHTTHGALKALLTERLGKIEQTSDRLKAETLSGQ